VVEPGDVVKVGTRLLNVQAPIHAILHKPRGYVVTADDERDRKTIFDLLPEEWPRVFHVGRLDKESEGLIIVTNDGDLSLALTHPRYKVEKEYEVTLDHAFDPSHRNKLLRGFQIIGGRAKMEAIMIDTPQRIRVVLMQGIKRQIRHMMYELGYEVVQLRRVRIGAVHLAKLRVGEWRMLTPKEVKGLKERKEPEAAPIKKPARRAKPSVRQAKVRSASAPRPPRAGAGAPRADAHRTRAPRADGPRPGAPRTGAPRARAPRAPRRG
jgi:23S rRNA pseudouridine2605 synthase